jgi:hypothetical protein
MWKIVTSFILIIIAFHLIAFWILFAAQHAEINSDQYQYLELMEKRYPKLIPIIKEKMHNNKIEFREYIEILDERDQLVKNNLIN